MAIALQALLFLAVIATGIHFRGVALGLFGGLGVVILVPGFGLAPGPLPVPVPVMLIILTVVTAGGAMQLAGGVDVLTARCERLLRRAPGRVTYVAPLATYVRCAGAGTGNVFCSLLPVIYEVPYAAGVRPERPLPLSATAGQLALVASPVSAATIAMVGLLAPSGFSLGDMLVILLPSSLAAILAAAAIVTSLGAELADDPEFLRRRARTRCVAFRPDLRHRHRADHDRGLIRHPADGRLGGRGRAARHGAAHPDAGSVAPAARPGRGRNRGRAAGPSPAAAPPARAALAGPRRPQTRAIRFPKAAGTSSHRHPCQ